MNTNPCKAYEPLLTEALFGTLDEATQQQLDTHLMTCQACANTLADLQNTLHVTAVRSRPALPPTYWTTYTEQLEERLAHQARPYLWLDNLAMWWRTFQTQRGALATWMPQLALAFVLIVVGIGIGRWLYAPEASDSPALAAQLPSEIQQVTAQRAHTYIDRSKVLLLGLVNFDAATDDPALLNLSRSQATAQALVAQTDDLKNALTQSDLEHLHTLIADLEVILLQIANLEATFDAPAIEMVQHGVDRKAILLKINLEEMRRAGEGLPLSPLPLDFVDTVRT